jgi:hypothetical protein
MRKVNVGETQMVSAILSNIQPFFWGRLDQGYFPEGCILHDGEALRFDLIMQAAGFQHGAQA